MNKQQSKATQAIHAGQVSHNEHGINTPIYPSSAFLYMGDDANYYPRYFNTKNQQVLAEKMAALENGESAMIFSSGMAAISTALLTFLGVGDHVVFCREIYGGTYNLATREFDKRGIEYSFADKHSAAGIADKIQGNTRVIYFETPSNPLVNLIDIAEVAEIARAKDIITMIDNTFASPINQNPIDFGIDMVLHSGTKYLGGHSDLCFGVMVSSEALKQEVYQTAINYGGSANALDWYLMERSLKTLNVRVKQQNENAMAIAEMLQRHEEVGRVCYPGLSDHPDHELAKRQMAGFGGMLAFELKTEDPRLVEQFLTALDLVQPALSLGGVETTICVPAKTSHIKMNPEARKAIHITDGLMRLSVGIEDGTDIMRDLQQALEVTFKEVPVN